MWDNAEHTSVVVNDPGSALGWRSWNPDLATLRESWGNRRGLGVPLGCTLGRRVLA